MDDAIEFLRRFAGAEYATCYARIREPDDEKFDATKRTLDAFYSGSDFDSGLSRPRGEPASEYNSEDNREGAKNLRPRSLFAVGRYQQGKGTLYRGWMGTPEIYSRGEAMGYSFFLKPVGEELKVVAMRRACAKCRATGKVNGGECPMCNAGWLRRGGLELRNFGKLVEVRKLQPPTNKDYVAAYEAIVAEA